MVVPATAYLGALGMTTGLTAYFGIVEVGAVGAVPGNDTVVVERIQRSDTNVIAHVIGRGDGLVAPA